MMWLTGVRTPRKVLYMNTNTAAQIAKFSTLRTAYLAKIDGPRGSYYRKMVAGTDRRIAALRVA